MPRHSQSQPRGIGRRGTGARRSARFRRRLPRAGPSIVTIAVTGVVRDSQGRILLLRRRARTGASRWGLPAGHVRAGETFRQAIARVVREDTGLAVTPGPLLSMRAGTGAAYLAACAAGKLRPGSLGGIEAAWFAPGALPAGILECHLALIRAAGRAADLGCNKTIKETATSPAQDRVMTRSRGLEGWR